MLKSEILYIQINENSFDCFDVAKGKREVFSSPMPFSSKRLAISDFEIAEKLLAKIIGYSKFKYFLKPKPTVIMHQRYNGEDISPVEIRVMQELGICSGAREVFVWQGHELNDQDIEHGAYKNS